MTQADPWLKYDPHQVKARLSLGAEPGKITTTNNGTKGNDWLREKSGAGLVNAVNSVNSSITKNCDSGYLNHNNIISYNSQTIYLQKNQKIRAVVAYGQRELGDQLTYIEFSLRNSSGTKVSTSPSSDNNVHIIEYTASQAGNYHFNVSLINLLYGGRCHYALEWRIT